MSKSNNATSVFTRHYNELMSIRDVEALKSEILRITQGINAIDRSKVVRTLQTINSLTGIQQYVTNSMFKFQGMRVL